MKSTNYFIILSFKKKEKEMTTLVISAQCGACFYYKLCAISVFNFCRFKAYLIISENYYIK